MEHVAFETSHTCGSDACFSTRQQWMGSNRDTVEPWSGCGVITQVSRQSLFQVLFSSPVSSIRSINLIFWHSVSTNHVLYKIWKPKLFDLHLGWVCSRRGVFHWIATLPSTCLENRITRCESLCAGQRVEFFYQAKYWLLPGCLIPPSLHNSHKWLLNCVTFVPFIRQK